MILLPRYPTSMFYNATTPAELQDEYNYIFYERYVNAGQNPCAILALSAHRVLHWKSWLLRRTQPYGTCYVPHLAALFPHQQPA